jgi:hypothetical protein
MALHYRDLAVVVPVFDNNIECKEMGNLHSLNFGTDTNGLDLI